MNEGAEILQSGNGDICESFNDDSSRVEAVRRRLPSDAATQAGLELLSVASESVRARILCALSESDLCVCELAELLGMSLPAVSHHIRVLKENAFIQGRKRGRFVFYSLTRHGPQAQVIAIDEAQFLDAGIVELVTSLAARGRRVILAGTDTDFRGEPFGPMPELMAIAEVVDKLHAICVLCGGPASRNQRPIGGQPAPYNSPQVMVGGTEAYEARCRMCHEVPASDASQVPLFRNTA